MGCGCGGSGRGLGAVALVPYRGIEPRQVPAWQVDPKALRSLIAAHSRAGSFGLGSLAGTTQEAVSVAGTALSGETAGISTAAAAVINLALSLLDKHYFNVAASNAACATQEQLWQSYLQVQGHVSGRSLGWATMQELMHAATGEGLFPGNNEHLSFHEGTLNCAGDGAWVDEFLCNGKVPFSSCDNCICTALQHYRLQRSSKPAGIPDAVWFIDSIFVPLFDSTAQTKWITAGMADATVHQLMYDLADAYLAENVSGTTAYVEFPAPPPAKPVKAAPAVVTPKGPVYTYTTPFSESATGQINEPVEEVIPETAANAPMIATAKAAQAAQAATPTPPDQGWGPNVIVTGQTPAPPPTPAATTTPTPATVPYTGTAASGSGVPTGLPNEEPTNSAPTTGSTAAQSSYAPPPAAVGLSTTDWILIVLGVGLGAYALSNSR